MGNGVKITIIGGGVGGYPAGIRAARMGAEVTLIEKDELGGVCLNRGCIPTKSLLQSGKVIQTIKESETFGIKCGEYKADFSAIMARKNRVVSQLCSGVQRLLAAKKIKVIKGTASILDSRTVQIEQSKEKIISDTIIIASGSSPAKLNIEGAGGPGVMNSDTFLEMKTLPQSVAIVGGGAIGCEFAQILNNLGVQVTILEMEENLIPGTDKEIARALQKSLVNDGIKVFTKAGVKKIEHRKNKNTIVFEHQKKSQKCEAAKVVFSVGRKPQTAALNVDKIGLAHQNGALKVNEYMETNISGIYAVGDVIGGTMLAHVATAEGECAVKNALGQKTRMNYKVIPACIYTSPEVASVGLSEEIARDKYDDVEVGLFPFTGCGKALVINETYGLVKIVAEKKDREILGVHIIGPHATDMISEAVLGMSMEMGVEDLANAIHPHPTLSESILESSLTLHGGAIHMP
ncbi:MAG: dihydrolipoyl dehydrogenase [Deltaproteobacteria bacterium]|jgi:dihydrolipoamide dehydrogenase|nr:dihydrolipoyl dehydrogenase [Deltaproteobacteria bacterium]MBT4268561.1 dihydrolipoyl dehydrogenase [Deltaproteobacteria bacterium]MBT4638455.1 dihydrolipoyl dehydrogenase [Deltaproteobacteria bacterium]MBT6503915.1 dihydrolipoyl dehydrogenase [Deltaproteobacteria bacterium]MBT7154351.1 dihydrolipoyl dehydrogenase [Deltaproteobacteria bacterium]